MHPSARCTRLVRRSMHSNVLSGHVLQEGRHRNAGRQVPFLGQVLGTGSRFFGEAQGASKKEVHPPEELAVMQGKRPSKGCSLAVRRSLNPPW